MAQGSVTSLSKGVWLLRWDGPRKPDGSRNQMKKRFRGTKAAAEDLVARLSRPVEKCSKGRLKSAQSDSVGEHGHSSVGSACR
jgi:hypothetical protein